MADCPVILVIRGHDGTVIRLRCTGRVLPPCSGRGHQFPDTGLELADHARFTVELEDTRG